MGDIIQFSNDNNLPMNPSDLQNLGAAAAPMGSGGDTDDLLRLLRDGMWVFGADNIEPEEESQWAINPYSFKHGFIAWHDSKVFGEVMVPIMQPLPNRGELQDAPEGWQEQISFQLQCVSGEDAGQQVLFKTTSLGGKRAASQMAQRIAAQAGQDAEHVVPVITLGVDSYQHKKYGKIYTPIFELVEWISLGGDANSQQAIETDAAKPEGGGPASSRGRRRSK